MSIVEDIFGSLTDGNGDIRNIRRFTLCNGTLKLQVINYGATIVSLEVPDVDGNTSDIVLGFDDILSFVNHTHYFGSTVGRFANRISKGCFALSNQKYQLTINNGPNHLHGGIKGFDKVIWDCAVENNRLILSYVSRHMEENYPGELSCRVIYEVTAENEVCISYHATTTALTPVNLTNHSYFNLGGHNSGTIEDQEIMINADFYTPVDETSIPTGEILPVDSTNFDLRKPTSIGKILNTTPSGMDHNFCINGKLNAERKVASVYHQRSGRLMEVYSTQPGVQFYTANFLPVDDSLIGKKGEKYKKNSAFCLETQNFPDAVNHANFPSALLDVNEEYYHTTKFRFIVTYRKYV